MKILIVGLGSIGQRHARILLENFQHELFVSRSSRHGAPNQLGIKELYSWDEVARIKPEVVFITNPTYLHIETALQCARLNMHLFIEKPLSHNMDGIADLAAFCQEKNLTCYTAYCLRFHPVIKELKMYLRDKKIYRARAVCSSYLPNWRPGTDYKKNYSANAAQGGGVLLDLSHEFDYLQYLFGPLVNLQGYFGRVSDVTVDAEDTADVIMQTVTGIHLNLHLDFMSHFSERQVMVDFENGYVLGDLLNNRVEWFENGKKEEKIFTTTRDEYFKEQQDYFFANLGNPQIMNNLQESSGLLKKILDFKSNCRIR